jgi:Fe-S-cluster containining protein
MQSNFDVQQFADDIRKMACDILSRDQAGADLDAAYQVRQFSEEASQRHIGTDSAIDCRAGCDHCCIVNVSVLQPEASSIADYLFNNQVAEELLDTYQYLHKLEKETACLDDEERIMTRSKCAFLNQAGSCSIYPVRPLLCRAVTSTDATACKDALSMIALGENRSIVSNLLQREIFETAFSSFGQILEEHKKDHRSHRLTAAVRYFLDKKLNNDTHHQISRGTHVN